MIWFSLLVLIPLPPWSSPPSEGGWAGFWNAITNEQTAAAIRLTVGTALLRHGGQRRDGHAHRLGPGPRPASSASGCSRSSSTSRSRCRRSWPAWCCSRSTARQPDRRQHRQHAARRCSSRSSSSRCRSWCARSSRCSPSSTARSRRRRPRSARAGSPPSAASSCPASSPAIAAGAALSFARGVSEYGSLVLLSGNLPFKTEVTSVRILSSIENDNAAGRRGRRDGAAGDLARRDRGRST